MINLNLIEHGRYVEGDYLNPRQTFGWNDELVETLKTVETAPVEMHEFFNHLEANLSESELEAIKDTPKGRNALYETLNSLGIKSLGIGKDIKHAVDDATKRLNKVYKHLAIGQYANFTAMKWDYLNPDYLMVDQIVLPNNKTLCIIEQLG